MFKSILLPVDGSPLSYRPLETAVHLAKPEGGKLIILSVAEPRMFNSAEPEALQNGKEVEASNIKSAKDNISKALASVNATGLPWEAVVSISATPHEVILETAKRFRCDLILMGARRKTGLMDTLLNESTTQAVLSNTSIPVLVFPSN